MLESNIIIKNLEKNIGTQFNEEKIMNCFGSKKVTFKEVDYAKEYIEPFNYSKMYNVSYNYANSDTYIIYLDVNDIVVEIDVI